MESFSPTTKVQAALTSALQAATAAGNPDVRPVHILIALLDQTDGIAVPLLKAVGADPGSVRAEAASLTDKLPVVTGSSSQPQLNREALNAVTAAQKLATELDDQYVSAEHVLVGLASDRKSVV